MPAAKLSPTSPKITTTPPVIYSQPLEAHPSITEIAPDKFIMEAMDKQAAAERERRKKVLEAEGDKTAAELESEGSKIRIKNLSEGEKIVAILSTTCQHCKHAAYKLKIAAEKYDLPPIYVVFKGAKTKEGLAKLEEQKDVFFKESNSDLPYSYFNDDRVFKMSKGIFPTILHIKNSEVFHVWHGSTLTYDELEMLENTVSKN